MLQARGLPPGACPEVWCLKCPEEVERVHRQYIDAGAQVIETCTFGGTALRLGHFGLAHAAREINLAAVEIARRLLPTAERLWRLPWAPPWGHWWSL